MIPDPKPGAHNLIFFSWADTWVETNKRPITKNKMIELVRRWVLMRLTLVRFLISSPLTGEDKGRGDRKFLSHPHPDPSTALKGDRNFGPRRGERNVRMEMKLRQTLGEDFSSTPLSR